MSDYITVSDQAGRLLAVLEGAHDATCTMPHNDLWTGSFSLPAADPKNEYCQAFNLVRFPTGARDVGLFRIIAEPNEDTTRPLQGVTTYNVEHVMATLMDDNLFGYHEIGGTGIYTRQVIDYILSFQSVKLWELGVCEFNDQFSYKFENTRLLPALLSLGNVLAEDYTWEFDTSSAPWRVNLRRADATPGCGIHYKRNMRAIRKEMDATGVVTRLYLLGYGEGINQLTVRSVNGGLPYIDADTIGKYWPPKCGIFADTRIEDPATLLARGRSVLDAYKDPYVCYTAEAVDLSRYTGHAWDMHAPGKLVHVLDSEHNLDFSARIASMTLLDILGDPDAIEISIANKPRDAADSMNALADRVGIGELYSQGATNLYTEYFADNADSSHPLRVLVRIPRSCVRVNQMILAYALEAFRTYSTGASAGGGSTQTSSSGGGGTNTSRSGGGSTQSTESTVVSNDLATGPALASGGDMITTTGTASPTTNSAGSHSHTVNSHSHSFSGSDSLANGHYHEISSPGTSTRTGGVSTNATHSVSISGTTGNSTPGTGTGGSHQHTVDAHAHNMAHYHRGAAEITIPSMRITIPSHTHDVDIPNHTHNVTIPAHTHPITYGIYEGQRASAVTIRVDGNTVPASAIQGGEVDIAAYLATDSDGKITRGTNHTIEITPNSLTRITGNVFVQTFIQSVGGGDY